MNDRLQELMDNVQRTAGQVGDVMADAAYGVGQKAGELLSVAKLRMQIASLEGAAEERLTEVGRMIYGTHTGDPTDSDTLLAKLQEIDELYRQIAELNARIEREQAAGVCPVCGADLRPGDVFCRECGGKL